EVGVAADQRPVVQPVGDADEERADPRAEAGVAGYAQRAARGDPVGPRAEQVLGEVDDDELEALPDVDHERVRGVLRREVRRPEHDVRPCWPNRRLPRRTTYSCSTSGSAAATP